MLAARRPGSGDRRRQRAGRALAERSPTGPTTTPSSTSARFIRLGGDAPRAAGRPRRLRRARRPRPAPSPRGRDCAPLPASARRVGPRPVSWSARGRRTAEAAVRVLHKGYEDLQLLRLVARRPAGASLFEGGGYRIRSAPCCALRRDDRRAARRRTAAQGKRGGIADAHVAAEADARPRPDRQPMPRRSAASGTRPAGLPVTGCRCRRSTTRPRDAPRRRPPSGRSATRPAPTRRKSRYETAPGDVDQALIRRLRQEVADGSTSSAAATNWPAAHR